MPEKSIRRRAVLHFPDYTFDISDINEDMTQSSATNPVEADADFAIGVSCASELKFSLNNIYQVISENALANQEFLLQRGKMTEYKSVLDVYKKVRKPLFVQHSGFTFAASDRAPYLSVYNSEFVLQDTPVQPTAPVESLFIINDKLYCIHVKSPLITAYSVSGGVLTMLPQITLTPFYQRKMIEEYVKNGRCFNKQGNAVTEYVSIYSDMKISEIIAETWQYSNSGYYIVKTPEKINDTKISVLAYDRMQKFDAIADSFLDKLTYPISLKALLAKLCEFVGVSFNSKTLLNENYMVPRNFKTEGVTCKQVLQWIAQIAASFAYFDGDGKLNISWYTNTDSSIGPDNSTNIDVSDYQVKPIEKVRIRVFETDLGVPYPDSEKRNIYIIENNPLLYALTAETILPVAINIYNAIKDFIYTPFSASVYVADDFVRAGMIVPANTVKGKSFQAYIMQSTITGVTGSSAEYYATGNEYRKTQTDVVNQTIKMLNGRTNGLVFDLEQTKNTLTTVETNLDKTTTDVGELRLTSKDFSVRLSSTEESLSGTNDLVASLELSINNFFVGLENSSISLTDKGFSTTYKDLEKNVLYTMTFGEGKQSFLINEKEIAYIQPFDMSEYWARGKMIKIEGTIFQAYIYSLHFDGIYWFDVDTGKDVRLFPHLIKNAVGQIITVFGTEDSPR